MEYILESIRYIVVQYPYFAYLLLLIVSFCENVVPPIPGDSILIFIALLLGKEALNFYIGLTFTCIGGIIGFMVCYYIGYYLEKDYILKKSWVSEERIKSVSKLFKNFGYFIILINRFLYGPRALIGFCSGMLLMDAKKVLLCASIGSVLWNYCIFYLGFTAGAQWTNIYGYIIKYNYYFLILSLLFFASQILFYYIVRFLKKYKKV